MNSDNNLWVHCLECDEIFREAELPIEKCVHCGNSDMQQTVYLEGER